MKKLLALALALVTAFSVTACAPKEKTAVNVYTIAGPTGVGMAKLMKDNEDQNTKNNYTFSVESSPEAVVSKIINGEADIAAVPTNLASTLYKKTEKKVEILAVNTLGVLYILENGDTVTDINSLKGKTIYSTGEGANPEYILKYILEKNGILNDVKIEFLAENEELAAKMISEDMKTGLSSYLQVLYDADKTSVGGELPDDGFYYTNS